ncbi:MAG: autotransporter-associated beta strand repeat-containing protein [Verrucomicrobia bacterium]|nr:autotransporter-associated beta strand repeat-containing protein [Verrucomicrobiota bacterium]
MTWDGGSGGGGTGWSQASNWDSNKVPGPTDVADFTLAGSSPIIGINYAGTTNNGAYNQAVGAIELLSGRARTIGNSSSNAATLTLNGATLNGVANIILRNGSASNLTLQNDVNKGTGVMDIALGNSTDNIVAVDSTGSSNISSVIKDGAGTHLSLAATSSGALVLSGNNTYTGGTTLGVTNTGTLRMLDTGTLGASSGALTIENGTLDLNGTSQNVGALRSTNANANGVIKNSSGTSSTLTVGNGDASGSFSGRITNVGNIALTKTGTGTQTLTNTNSYTGQTVGAGGTLQLANPNGVALSGTSSIVVNNGGTLLMGANNQVNRAVFPPIALGSTTGSGAAKLDAGGFSQGTGGTPIIPNSGSVGLGALTLNAGAIVDLTGTSVLHFANSSSSTWSGRLSIYDWTGTPVTGGGAEQILFGGDITGLNASQLSQISFYSDNGMTLLSDSALILADGEIIPGLTSVPEAETAVAAVLALGMIVILQRQRLRAQLARF